MGWFDRLGHRGTSRQSDPKQVILYTRKQCCLCEETKKVLEKYGLTIHEVDIDRDPELREKYDQCVPVVEIDGKERFRGKVNEVLLRRLLR